MLTQALTQVAQNEGHQTQGSQEILQADDSLPLSLWRACWPNRQLLQQFRDMLPKFPLPLPPPQVLQVIICTPPTPPAPPSVSLPCPELSAQQECAQPQVCHMFRTQLNLFGLFWVYNSKTFPVHDPEDTPSLPHPSQTLPHPTTGETPYGASSVNSFHPYLNESSFRLRDWYWNQGTTKSRQDFKSLLDIIGSSDFQPNDICNTKWTSINCKLGNIVASDNSSSQTIPSTNLSDSTATFFQAKWMDNDAGWRNRVVVISVPFPRRCAHPGPKSFTCSLYYRSLISVMREKILDPMVCHPFYYELYELHWHPPHQARDIGVHGKLFTSQAFLKAHNQFQQMEAVPRCNLPRQIIVLMFWLDAMQLTSFGDAKLWPLYIFFGNNSKYERGQPFARLCNHVAYFETVSGYTMPGCITLSSDLDMTASRRLQRFCTQLCWRQTPQQLIFHTLS